MKKLLSILVFSFYFNAFAVIITTDEISIIKNILNNEADKNTLVILDCNDVLIESEDRILQADNKKIYQFYWNKHFNTLSEYNQRYHMVITKLETKYQLLDKDWPKLIRNLQNRDIKTILLTSAPVGKIGNFNAFEDIRFSSLLENGIDFSISWKNVYPFIFKELAVYKNGINRCPIFKNGMLVTDGLEKGNLLYSFLIKNPQCKINKIIFIDNKMKHIYSIKDISEKIKAKYIGVNYSKSLTSKRQPVDIEIVKKQFEILLKRKKWITDKVINSTYNKVVWIFRKPLAK